MLARPKPVCDVLHHTVMNYMIKTFGENVYQEFITDLVDYSSYAEWSSSETYEEGDIRLYDGVYYVLNVAESTLSDTPNCNSEWSVAPKFNKACFNDMFSINGGGLLKLLSWVVWAKAAPFYPNVLGLTDFMGTDKEYKQKINFYLQGVEANIRDMENVLSRWNRLNKCVTIFVCEPSVGYESTAGMNIAWD